MGRRAFNFEDLTGRTFGRLTVQKYDESDGNRSFWLCVCECGNKVVATTDALKRIKGGTKSCGCLQKDFVRRKFTKHGYCAGGTVRVPEYHVWQSMIGRCKGRGVKGRYYLGRIVVCDRWLHSFTNFFADMGSRQTPKHTLEREDNDGPYSPNNCIWATRRVQARNTRGNHNLTLDGRTQCVMDWAIELGINVSTIFARIRYGWSVKEILTTPVRTKT